MLRAIIKRKQGCRISGFDGENVMTVDFESSVLEEALSCGLSESGYDIREVVGVEIIRVNTEQLIVEAFKRGAEWKSENPENAEYATKAAWDYADKTTSK